MFLLYHSKHPIVTHASLFMVSGQPQEKAKSSRARTSYTPLFGLNDHARDPLKGKVFRVLRLKTGYMILLFGVSDVLKEYESWR